MLALANYEEKHGTLPPAFLTDTNGKPVHSWRVLILPYMEEQALYDRYDFDEPWDGPNNKQLLDEMPFAYSCPSHGHHGDGMGHQFTNYVRLSGDMAFLNESETYHSTTERAQKTIVATEVNRRSVPWTSPHDISANEFVSMFGSHHDNVSAQDEPNHDGGVVVVGYADGQAGVIPVSADQSFIRSLVINKVTGGDGLAGED